MISNLFNLGPALNFAVLAPDFVNLKSLGAAHAARALLCASGQATAATQPSHSLFHQEANVGIHFIKKPALHPLVST